VPFLRIIDSFTFTAQRFGRMKLRKKGASVLVGLGFLFTGIGCSTSAFFFYPSHDIVEYPSAKNIRFDTVYIPVKGKKELHGWFLYPPSDVPVIGTIIHFHGNAANVAYQYQSVVPLVNAGYQALVFDYRGYGMSEGRPNQQRVLADGLAAVDYCVKRKDVFGTKVVLFGQSLGGHLACVVANKRQSVLDALVIEGAFTGHEDIAAEIAKSAYKVPRWFSRLIVPSKYDGIEHLANVSIPVLVIHSDEDEAIPFEMGEALFEAASQPKVWWPIHGKHIRASQDYPGEFVTRFEQILAMQ
jgi:fermentation-respiration switch protein FrsA (DUF1100 family)